MYLLCCCSPGPNSENSTSKKKVSLLTPTISCNPVRAIPIQIQHSRDRAPDFAIVPWEKQQPNRNNFFTELLNKIKIRLSGDVNYNSSELSRAKKISDAELARRAELKRIRTRRIREELKVNDATSQQLRKEKVSAPLLQSASRNLGPRDAIEFAIDSDSLLPMVDDSQSFTSSAQIEKRRNSFPFAEHRLLDLPLPRKSISLNFASAYSDVLPANPETAHLAPPSKMKGCLEPSPTLDTVVGPGNCFSAASVASDDAGWDRQSGLSLWLLSQGMSSGDTRSPSPAETRHDDTAAYATNRSLSLAALNTIDSIVEMPLPVWDGLVDSSTARLVHPSPVILLHPVPDSQHVQVSSEENDVGINAMCDQQESMTGRNANHSSVSPDGDTILTITPPAEPVLSPDDLRTLELSPFHCKCGSKVCFAAKLMISGHDTGSVFRVSEKSESQSSYATAAEVLEVPRLSGNIGPVTDVNPIEVTLQSHRVSLERRELELQSIAKRFSKKATHPKTWHSRKSRFLEDFGSIRSSTNTKRRLSSLFRIYSSTEEATAKATKDDVSELELPPLRRTHHHMSGHTQDNDLPLSGHVRSFRSISMPISFSAAVMTSLSATTSRERGNESVVAAGAQQPS